MTPPSVPTFSSADTPAITKKKVGPKAQKADGPMAVVKPTAIITPPATPKLDLPARRGPRSRDLVDGKSELVLVPIGDLRDDPENPRKTFRNIMELAASMKVEGLLQPIVCRKDIDGTLIIMWGHRRVRAARILQKDPDVAASWTHVHVIIRYGVKTGSILAKQLIENKHRDDLDPIEEARGIRYYMLERRIATYQECADKLGTSLAWVAGRVALLDLDQTDQEKVSAREIPLMDAIKKARIKSGKTRVSKIQREGREPDHFSDEHFLAGRARSRCNAGRNAGETHRPVLGNVACGACWETVIRSDARREALQAG